MQSFRFRWIVSTWFPLRSLAARSCRGSQRQLERHRRTAHHRRDYASDPVSALGRRTGLARTNRFRSALGNAFVPLGALALGLSIPWPAILAPSGALQDAGTTGAIGTMSLAVMTRATLGHTGREIVATPPTAIIYAAILVAALARIVAPMLPSIYHETLVAAALGWIVAFGGFVIIYGPMLVRARRIG